MAIIKTWLFRTIGPVHEIVHVVEVDAVERDVVQLRVIARLPSLVRLPPFSVFCNSRIESAKSVGRTISRRLQGFPQIYRVAVHTQEEQLRLGPRFLDLPRSVNPVEDPQCSAHQRSAVPSRPDHLVTGFEPRARMPLRISDTRWLRALSRRCAPPVPRRWDVDRQISTSPNKELTAVERGADL
jgi:hypothetical protein